MKLMLISLIFIVSCIAQMKSQKIKKNNTELLYGEISKDQLYFDYPVWEEQESVYKPKKEVVNQISADQNDFNVHIFLGTWCGDSRRNVPRFFKSIKGNKHLTYTISAVDRRKKLDNDLIEKYKIHRVPTFVFEKNGVEIGRITEHPKKTIEEDILDIIKSK